MNCARIRILALAMLVAASGGAVELPSAYRIISERNIFNATRHGPRTEPPQLPPQSPPPTTAPISPSDIVTLTGVVIINGAATAIFAASLPELARSYHLGDNLDSLLITAIDTAAVALRGPGDELFAMAVGNSLIRQAPAAWQLSSEQHSIRTTASSTSSAGKTISTPVPAASQASTVDPNLSDVLSRMRQRRQQELNQ